MSLAVPLLMMLILLVAGVLASIIVVCVLRPRAAAEERTMPRLRAEATVVDKRSEVTGGGETRAVQHYYVTFQFPDGNRVERAVTGPESGLLARGDTGTVEWQGSRYLGFAREILR